MTTTPESASPEEDALPNDRELALHELNSITEQMRNASLYPYSRKAFRRDRIIGWVVLAVIISGLAALAFNQLVSTADLRRSLYETCVQNNARDQDRVDFYRLLANRSNDPEFTVLLNNESARLAPRDCAAKYLDQE